jgi:hypothetical protein
MHRTPIFRFFVVVSSTDTTESLFRIYSTVDNRLSFLSIYYLYSEKWSLAGLPRTSKLSATASTTAQKSHCRDRDTNIITMINLIKIDHKSVNQNTGGVTLIILIHGKCSDWGRNTISK